MADIKREEKEDDENCSIADRSEDEKKDTKACLGSRCLKPFICRHAECVLESSLSSFLDILICYLFYLDLNSN